MTYASAIAQRSVNVRWIVKIAGVPRYLTNYGATTDTYNDGGTHGSLSLEPRIISLDVSAGRLDYERRLVTPSTCTIRLQDSATLRSTFARRVTTATTLNEAVDAASPTPEPAIDVVTGASLTDDAYCYCGRECMLISAIATNTLTVTRACLGTSVQAHPFGASIATTRRHWIGAKVWLVLGVQDADGTGGWSYQDPHRVFYVDESPSYHEGTWEIRCSDALSQFDRKIYTGFEAQRSEAMSFEDDGTRTMIWIQVPDSSQFAAGSDTALQDRYVKVEYGGTSGVYRINAIASSVIKIDLVEKDISSRIGDQRACHQFGTGVQGEHGIASSGPIDGSCLCSPVFPPRGSDGKIAADVSKHALRIMLSDLGDLANGADYDVIPGAVAAVSESASQESKERHGGACLTTGDVDVASWLAAGASATAGGEYILGYSGPESLLDVLSQDFAPVLGGYVYVTAAGKLAFKKYSPATTATSIAFTVTDTNSIDPDNTYDDESVVASTIEVAGGYSWKENEYTQRHIVHNESLRHDVGDRDRTVTIESRLGVTSPEIAQKVGDYHTSRWGRGAVRTRLKLPFAASGLLPSDVISYTNSRIPAHTGSDGVSAGKYEVMSTEVDYHDGSVRCAVVEMPSARLIAPVLEITADLGSGEYTVSETATAQTDASTEWCVGWVVQVISAAGVVRGTCAITDIADDYLEVDSAPAGTTTGDFVTLCALASQTGTSANTGASAAPTDYCYLDDDNDSRDRWA